MTLPRLEEIPVYAEALTKQKQLTARLAMAQAAYDQRQGQADGLQKAAREEHIDRLTQAHLDGTADQAGIPANTQQQVSALREAENTALTNLSALKAATDQQAEVVREARRKAEKQLGAMAEQAHKEVLAEVARHVWGLAQVIDDEARIPAELHDRLSDASLPGYDPSSRRHYVKGFDLAHSLGDAKSLTALANKISEYRRRGE